MGLTGGVGVAKAGLEPDKEALSDKETAGIKAIAGPEGDKMVTIFPRGTDGEDQGGVRTPLSLVTKPVKSRPQSLFLNTHEGLMTWSQNGCKLW